jgi:hypothetical protein
MIIQTLATELAVQPAQVKAAVALLDEGATVPFIARYRKEITNGLDDTQLRNLESRLSYLRELHDRKRVILKSITDQGKLPMSLLKPSMMQKVKRYLKTYTYRISRVAALKVKSQLKPVLSLWPMLYIATRHSIRRTKQLSTSMLRLNLQTKKPCLMALNLF